MIKKITLILGLLAAAAGTAFATNVVVLDLNAVLEKFSKAVAVKTEVEAKAKDADDMQKIKFDEFAKKRDELNKALENLKTTENNPTLSAKAKADAKDAAQKLYTEVAKMEQNLRQSQQQTQQFLQKLLVEKMNVVLREDVQPRIEAIAKNHNAEIVIQRNNAVFVDPSADITSELIALLEKDFPTESAPAPTPASTPAPAPEK